MTAHDRPLARLVATLALLVLGGFALARLPLDRKSVV